MSKKLKQLSDNQSHDNLIQLLSIQTPDERQKLLQNIDSILCNILDLKPNDLPWLNPNKHEEKWEKLMKNLRLIIGKIEYESIRKERTVH